jgi:tumor necrosis factor ligand superfamily protein 10
MPSSGALKDLSFSQHFRMMVICIVLLQVLLQAVSVAVTYMYFTNEMKQVSGRVLSAAASLGFAA